MRGRGWIVAVAFAAILSACTSADDTFGNPADGYPDSARDVANNADWTKAERVKIDLAEFRYAPESLVFHLGQPYILNLVNTGSLPHRFVAKEFFRGVAARRLLYTDAESSYPALDGIALEPREMKTLYFVPVTPGNYHVSCDRPLHALLGMTGAIHIK
jgi:uncharacterized cupredoxin-like copper-binding protein